MGVIFQITSGASTSAAPPGLASFSLDKTLGIPNALLIAIVAILIVAGIIRSTVVGRRFVAVGASPAAAHAAGVRVKAYEVATYVFASITYGAAGILVAGFLEHAGHRRGQQLPAAHDRRRGARRHVARRGRRQRRRDRRGRALPDAARSGRARHGLRDGGAVHHPGRRSSRSAWRSAPCSGGGCEPAGGNRPPVAGVLAATVGGPPSSQSLPPSGAVDPTSDEMSPASHPRDEPGQPPSNGV